MKMKRIVNWRARGMFEKIGGIIVILRFFVYVVAIGIRIVKVSRI